MPLLKDEKDAICKIAEDFNVKRVWLFGSSLDEGAEANDIDLAVEGIQPEKFFKFYGRLFDALTKMVDLVDMDTEPPIRHLIRKTGKIIYG